MQAYNEKLTRRDIIKALSIIRITYPNAYPTQTDEDESMLIEVWYEMFVEYPREIFFAALKKAMATSEFFPKPATITKAINDMQEAYEKDEHDLWEELTGTFREVLKCAGMLHYTFIDGDDGLSQGEKARRRLVQIYNALDPALKDYCRNTGALIELARYTDEQLSYERGRFMRTMPIVRERVRTRLSTPDNIKSMLQEVTAKRTLQISGGNTPTQY